MKQLPWIIVLAIGMIVAVCAAAKLPLENEKWPNTWPMAIVGLGIAAAGVVGWRRSERFVEPDAEADSGRARVHPMKLIEQLSVPLKQLSIDAQTLNAEGIQERIDQLQDQYLLPVTDARQQLISELGISKAAEVLIDFASTERYLNRAWTAAGDGNLDEAILSIHRCVDSV